MIATATPWNTRFAGTEQRTYFTTGGERAVTAEVTTDHGERRVWFIAWVTTGARDRWGNPIREVITRGSYALTRYAAAVAKRYVSRIASKAAYAEATAYYQRAMTRALERVADARALLDATDLTDYRTLVARQDELAQLTVELAEVERRMYALAA